MRYVGAAVLEVLFPASRGGDRRRHGAGFKRSVGLVFVRQGQRSHSVTLSQRLAHTAQTWVRGPLVWVPLLLVSVSSIPPSKASSRLRKRANKGNCVAAVIWLFLLLWHCVRSDLWLRSLRGTLLPRLTISLNSPCKQPVWDVLRVAEVIFILTNCLWLSPPSHRGRPDSREKRYASIQISTALPGESMLALYGWISHRRKALEMPELTQATTQVSSATLPRPSSRCASNQTGRRSHVVG